MAQKFPKQRTAPRAPKTRAKRLARPSARKRKVSDAPAATKLAALIALLDTPQGATLAQMMSLTGWQAHSVRGAMSGALKKKRKLSIVSKKVGEERVYHIASKR